MVVAKKILVGFVLLLVVAVAIGFALSDEVTVTRASVVAAEPEAIHEVLASLRTWPEWSVWNRETDPTLRFEFEGAERGVGATWKWKGDVFEEGQLEILESDPARGVSYRVTMASGLSFEGGLRFTEAEAGTRVTWTDKAALGMGPLGGWMALLLGGAVDEEVGRGQEQGLAGLKARLERAPVVSAK